MNERKRKRGLEQNPETPKEAESMTTGAEKTVCHDVGKLDPEQRDQIRKMLVDGATFEDTVASFFDSTEIRVTIRAVENYFRSDSSVQQDRIRRTVELARNLKKALSNPDSAHAELAESVLITGLMGLRTSTAASGMQNAIKVKSQEESNRLKEETNKLRAKKMRSDNRILKVRLEHELEKIKALKQRFEQLQNEVEREGKGQRVGPETIKRIQEIYGLLSDHELKADNDAQTPEA